MPANQVTRHKPRRAHDHRESVEVRLVDKAQDALLQFGERRFCDNVLILPGLEIAPREQSYKVGQFPPPEFGSERNPQHIGVCWVVDIIVYILEPAHLGEELRGCKGFVALLDAAQEVGGDGQMAEIVDRLAQHVAAVGLVGGDLRHGKIGLR